jgi:DNA-binding transcriptional regulator YdaS (Cro superfamily)
MANPHIVAPDLVRALLKRAAKNFGGSESKLAKAAGYSQNAVWTAKRLGRISAELAMAIEVATEGVVTAREFRPDLPWPAFSAPTIPSAGSTAHRAGAAAPGPIPETEQSPAAVRGAGDPVVIPAPTGG